MSTAEVAPTAAEHAKLQAKLALYQAKLKLLRKHINQELKRGKEAAAKPAKDTEATLQRLSELNMALKYRDSRIAELEAAQDEAALSVKTLTEDQEASQEARDAQGQALTKQKAANMELAARITELETGAAAAQRAVQDHKTSMKTLQLAFEASKDNVSKLEQQVREQDDELALAASKSAQMQQLKTLIKELTQAKNSAEQRLQGQESVNTALTTRLEALELQSIMGATATATTTSVVEREDEDVKTSGQVAASEDGEQVPGEEEVGVEGDSKGERPADVTAKIEGAAEVALVEANATLKRTREDVNTLRLQNAEVMNKLDNALKAAVVSASKISDLEQAAQMAVKKHSDLAAAHMELTDELVAVEEKQAASQAAAVTQASELTHTQQRLRSANTDWSASKKQVETLTTEKEVLQAKLGAKIRELEKSGAQQVGRASAMEAELEGLTQLQSTTQDKLTRAQEQLGTSTEQLQQLKQASQNVNAQLEAVTAELAQTTETLSTRANQYDQLLEGHEALLSTHEKALASLSAKESKHDELAETVALLHEQNAELAMVTENLRQTLTTQTKEAEKELQSAQADIAELRSQHRIEIEVATEASLDSEDAQGRLEQVCSELEVVSKENKRQHVAITGLLKTEFTLRNELSALAGFVGKVKLMNPGLYKRLKRPTPTALPKVILEGYLYRREQLEQGGKITWVKHFCTLSSSNLLSFCDLQRKTEKSSGQTQITRIPCGQINLKGPVEVKQVAYNDALNGIRVQCYAPRKTVAISCNTAAESSQWFTALKHATTQARSPTNL